MSLYILIVKLKYMYSILLYRLRYDKEVLIFFVPMVYKLRQTMTAAMNSDEDENGVDCRVLAELFGRIIDPATLK